MTIPITATIPAVIQVAAMGNHGIVALCEDGSVWFRNLNVVGGWEPVGNHTRLVAGPRTMPEPPPQPAPNTR